MSFFVYAKDDFFNEHEKRQSKIVLDSLKTVYKDDPSDYCYCFLNIPYHHNDVNLPIRGQFDIIVFTRQSVSTIEMKSKSGKLIGEVNQNYKNKDVRLIYPNGKTESISIHQVEDQQQKLKSRLSKDFRREMKKSQEEHYRIDSYLLFTDDMDFSTFSVSNEQISKWLKVVTESSFIKVWKETNHNQPFTLTESDIHFIAEQHFQLFEVDPDTYSLSVSLFQKRLFNINDNNKNQIFPEYGHRMFKSMILENISESEYYQLIHLRDNIRELNDEEKVAFRQLVRKIKPSYFSNERFDHYYLNTVMSVLKELMSIILNIFTMIPKIAEPFDRKNMLKPSRWRSTLYDEKEKLNTHLDKIKMKLDEYTSFYSDIATIEKNTPEDIKDIERALRLLDICSKEEKK